MGTIKRSFDFKDHDEEGEGTLEVLTGAKRLNHWLFETATSPLRQAGAEVIEVGSGIGNISEEYLNTGLPLVLSDIRPQYCQRLRERFAARPNLRDVVELDLVAPNFEQRYADLLGRFDGLFSLNVVEHIEDHERALANARLLLKPGGRMVILVPAFEALYNRFDEALYHYRRYTRQTLSAAMTQAGLAVERSFYFNAFGMLGWFVSGKLQGNRTIPGWQVKVYEALVPAFKLLDGVVKPWLGLSVIAIARRIA